MLMGASEFMVESRTGIFVDLRSSIIYLSCFCVTVNIARLVSLYSAILVAAYLILVYLECGLALCLLIFLILKSVSDRDLSTFLRMV